ncbi:MAG: lipase maturation factor family protein [Polyangiaceae bacterium]
MVAASYRLTRFAFLRGLGLIYFVGFLTLALQWRPLIGSDGLLPAADFLSSVHRQLGSYSSAFWRLPSLFWLSSSDATMEACAWLGVALSLSVSAGFANAPLLSALWLLYLSFVHIGQIFYGYGWESLLCETGFLAIFLVPALSLKPLSGSVPWPVLFLLRWLSFRVMFGAGLIKLRGDPCWHDLSCLNYHYETQPLPNPFSALYHHLPARVHQLGVLFNHFVELIVPFGVFGPRRVRHAAGALIIVFQLCLISSGNLAFLNWLTIVVTLSCFDDTAFARLLPNRWRPTLPTGSGPLGRPRWIVTGLLLSVIGLLSFDPLFNLLSPKQRMNAGFDPFSLVNTYGAFGSITRERNEIVLEGSAATSLDENTRWVPFELPCKPGDPARRPCFVAPYQYKLDWQLWFAAFGSAGQEPWLLHLIEKLLRGDHVVDSLFALQPFQDQPPRYVRALFYRYRFAEAGQAGSYWQRELLGEYLRPLSLDDPDFQAYLASHGFEPTRAGDSF